MRAVCPFCGSKSRLSERQKHVLSVRQTDMAAEAWRPSNTTSCMSKGNSMADIHKISLLTVDRSLTPDERPLQLFSFDDLFVSLSRW